MISGQHGRPLACWRGKERHDGTILECLTVIFKTAGCTWNQCLMCGYRHERFTPAESSAGQELPLLSQLAWVQERHRPADYQMVKIFTSGSFFDRSEIPLSVLGKIAAAFRGKLVIAETRPEFVNSETITPFLEKIDDGSWAIPLYCAVGLETSDDSIREKCIRKGFSYNDFTGAARRAHTLGAGVKAYLLLKPLFLTEREAVDDMNSSIRDAVDDADLISMNPCTVQGHTELEWYWRQGAYRPPFLWSVLSVLNEAPVHITCDPVGAGRKRGPHNCGSCDRAIIQGIRDYSLNGDRDLIASLLEIECGCKEEWMYVLDQEMPFCMPLTQ